jgi:hypothetical protein
MRIFRSSVLALILSTASVTMVAPTAHAQVPIDIRVAIAPPPLPFYEQPIIPAEGYIWVPGYWAWDQAEDDYYWVPGTWVEPPQRELLWTPAYWGWVDGRYAFYPGYWAREVGFYGGIDYGYGYTGEGYLGGRWDNGVFFYNRSVNNIESVHVTNIYNQRVVVNNRSINVSFNGGNGGTAVRPTPQQEALARERHVDATPVQRQQVEMAAKDRTLFSKQNHGEPAVAATPRAGVFQGAGVSRGSRTPVAARSGNVPPSSGAERPAQPMSNEKEAPKAEERMPSRQPAATEEQHRPAEEPRMPTEERPKVEEQRRPAEEPSRAEEQRMPAQAPRMNEPRPMPQRPAPRAPAEERR